MSAAKRTTFDTSVTSVQPDAHLAPAQALAAGIGAAARVATGRDGNNRGAACKKCIGTKFGDIQQMSCWRWPGARGCKGLRASRLQ